MEYKCVFEDVKLRPGAVYVQDFTRLKAILLQCASACYLELGRVEKSEQFNDMAIAEDPDLGATIVTKMLIHEKRSRFSQALSMAEYGIEKFEDPEEEEQDNIDLLPVFYEAVERLKPLLPREKSVTKEKLKHDVYKEVFGEDYEEDYTNFFRKVNGEEEEEEVDLDRNFFVT